MELVCLGFEKVAAFAVVAEHVERGGARREKHHVAGARQLRGPGDRLLEARDLVAVHAGPGLRNPVLHFPDEDGGADPPAHERGDRVELEPFVLAAGDQDHRRGKLRQRGFRGMEIGRLGIVDIGHAIQFGDQFLAVCQARIGGQGGGNAPS